MVWLLAQSVSAKALAFLTQLVLAKLLAKEDFGQIGLAYTVTALAGLVANPGIDVILVRKHRHARRWITPCFWLGLTLGVAAGLLMLVAAPIGAHLYQEPRVFVLVSVLACAAPIGALSIVPSALLSARMRFRELAAIGVLGVAVTSILTITFAGLGFGALSFALPVPLSAALVAIAQWSRVTERPAWRPQRKRWSYLIGDSSLLFTARAASTVIAQADYAILGAMFSAQVVGVYFFGFNFAVQGVRLLAGNISSVVLPSLTAMNDDPVRQVQAALRASRVLAVVGSPLCILQALVVAPLFGLLFGGKWDSAIPIVQCLSIGLACDVPAWVGIPLANAQGRYALVARLYVCWVPVFIALVLLGAWFGASTGVSIAVGVYYLVMSSVGYGVILRAGGAKFATAFVNPVRPWVACAVAGLVTLAISESIPIGPTSPTLALIVIAVLFGVAYVASLWCLARRELREASTLLNIIAGRIGLRGRHE